MELADGGTLFLDELGDIPQSIQVKLLRLLETGTYRPVGSVEVRSSSFRLVCATHKDLYQMVLENQFRNDLYYRINVYPIHIPALRERIADIPLIAKSLLSKLAANEKYKLTSQATKLFTDYEFKGNIRELRNLLNRAIVISDTLLIDQKIIQQCLDEDNKTRNQAQQFSAANASKEKNSAFTDLKTNEDLYIKKVLDAHEGNKEEAAQTLGISIRSLYRKLNAKD